MEIVHLLNLNDDESYNAAKPRVALLQSHGPSQKLMCSRRMWQNEVLSAVVQNNMKAAIPDLLTAWEDRLGDMPEERFPDEAAKEWKKSMELTLLALRDLAHPRLESKIVADKGDVKKMIMGEYSDDWDMFGWLLDESPDFAPLKEDYKNKLFSDMVVQPKITAAEASLVKSEVNAMWLGWPCQSKCTSIALGLMPWALCLGPWEKLRLALRDV